MDLERAVRFARAPLAGVLLLSAGGCEPEGTGPPPSTPASYPNPYIAQNRGWGQPMPPPVSYPTPAPPPASPPPHRRIDLSLDVPPPPPASSPLLDVRNPFAGPMPTTREPEAPPPPSTYLVVVLALDKAGKPQDRSAAARKLLAARGAVKRGDGVWEFPTPAPDRTPEAIRAELKKVLCNEDRAAMLFAHDGKMAKVELAGDAGCDGPR